MLCGRGKRLLRNRKYLLRPYSVLIAVLGLVSAVSLLGMMLLTFVDVVARYIFNSPIYGGTVLIEVFLVSVIFFGLPLATNRDEHITIDLLDHLVPNYAKRFQQILICATCALSSGFLARQFWLKGEYAETTGETTVALSIPVSFLLYPMSILTAVVGMIFIGNAAVLVVSTPATNK